MNRNTSSGKYLFHKKTFNIKNSPILDLFESLLKLSTSYTVECSAKISEEEVFTERVYLWYHGDFNHNLRKVFDFMNLVSKVNGVKLDTSLLEKIWHNFNATKIKRIVCAVDLRPNMEESRVKLYFDLFNYDSKISQVCSLCGLKNLPGTPFKTSLFGLDFNLSGESRLKLYPHLKNPIVSEEKNTLSLPPRVLDLLDMCHSFSMCLFGSSTERTMHFFPSEREKFVKLLGNSKLEEIYSLTSQLKGRSCVLGLVEHEIVTGDIKSINYYY